MRGFTDKTFLPDSTRTWPRPCKGRRASPSKPSTPSASTAASGYRTKSTTVTCRMSGDKGTSDSISTRLIDETLARLVLGDVEATVGSFLQQSELAAIGFVTFDLDYYLSTVAALALLDAPHALLLPLVYCYFDDLIGATLVARRARRRAVRHPGVQRNAPRPESRQAQRTVLEAGAGRRAEQ